MRHCKIDMVLWRKKFLNLNGHTVCIFAYVKNRRKGILYKFAEQFILKKEENGKIRLGRFFKTLPIHYSKYFRIK